MVKFRGLEKRHEQQSQEIIRDTRTLAQRFLDAIRNPAAAAITLFILSFIILFFPMFVDVGLLYALFTFAICSTQSTRLPFRLPTSSNKFDYNDLKPGTNKPRKAAGIVYFGNELSSSQELWFTNDDMRTHVLIFGSTGSGKTEALVSLSYNALVQGSGLIYVDGKGDNALFAKIFSLARKMGREDDLLLINFMTGARDIVGPQKTRISNTMNPFSNGSSSMLAQLVVSMMDQASQSPDGDMWKGRAISFVEALMKLLVFMRDEGHILLDVHAVRNYFHLPRLETIVIDRKFPIDDEKTVPLDDVPEVVMQPLENFLGTLPGFDRNKKGKQSSETLEQFGFITMQLTRAFTSLADTYGHILRTELGEVDFRDVVLNRRILVVLLPALEKAPEELANLGKIIVASLKAMMASGLGEEVEGEYKALVERKPTNSPTPFMCILDEYGYYAVKGFAIVPAQARSLGFSAIFAGQDLPAFQKVSKEEAASIGANTNIKICMKLEDPTETWEFFQKTAAEAYVTHTSGFQSNINSVTNSYLDNRSAQLEKRARIDILDLKDQREGEAHIFFKSNIVRARMFYANPAPCKSMKLNQFLKVAKPSEKELITLYERLERYTDAIQHPEYMAKETPDLGEDLSFVASALKAAETLEPNDRAITVFTEYYRHEHAVPEAEVVAETEAEAKPMRGMDIFTQPSFTMPENIENFDPFSLLNSSFFGGPLLDKAEVQRNLERIERLLGKSKQDSHTAIAALIEDVRSATYYPPPNVPKPETPAIVTAIGDIVADLQRQREEGGGA
jgi:intracellular multiplication protein IcmO